MPMNPSSEFFNPLRPDIGFDLNRIQSLLEQDLIRNSDADFLQNVANEAVVNPEVVNAVNLYRMRVGNDLKPGQELFIRMQELGLKNHPLTGLDISSYHLPQVNLIDANFGGILNMSDTVVDRNVYQQEMKAEDVYQVDMKARRVDQRAMKAGVVCQQGMKAERVDQAVMKARRVDQKRMEAGDVDQREMKAGVVCQQGMKAERVNQKGMETRDIDQVLMEAKWVDQRGMKAGRVDQDGMQVKELIKD